MAEVAQPTYYSVYYTVHCYKTSAVSGLELTVGNIFHIYIFSFSSYLFLLNTKSTIKNPNHGSSISYFINFTVS